VVNDHEFGMQFFCGKMMTVLLYAWGYIAWKCRDFLKKCGYFQRKCRDYPEKCRDFTKECRYISRKCWYRA
jgi:hypothetical protein